MADVVVLGGDGLRCRSLLYMLTSACDRFQTEAHIFKSPLCCNCMS
jgi:hypothetical protein